MPRHPPYALISLIFSSSQFLYQLSFTLLVSFLTSSFQVNYKTYFIFSKIHISFTRIHIICVLFICSCQCASQEVKKSIKQTKRLPFYSSLCQRYFFTQKYLVIPLALHPFRGDSLYILPHPTFKVNCFYNLF